MKLLQALPNQTRSGTMNVRIAKKLKREMESWRTPSARVRHRRSTLRAAWRLEVRAILRGDKWAK